MSRLAIDYDGTYTADPALWDEFIRSAIERGHDVRCVTMRRPDEAIEMPCPIIYTSRAAKMAFVEAAGIPFDIWIDDAPHWLVMDSLAEPVGTV